MSLNYDWSKVEDKSAVVRTGTLADDGVTWTDNPDGEDQKLTPLAEAMVWALMAVGLNEIKRSNMEELFIRLHMYEHASGAYRKNKDGDVFFTLDDVKSLVGLHTNVSNMTKLEFEKRLTRQLREDAQRALRYAKE